MKFDLATFKQVKLANSATFLQPQFNAATCSCDNAVLEAHYKVLVTGVERPNSFEIKESLVDVVYGSTDKTDACKSANHYQLKTSLTYLQYNDIKVIANKYNGAPGYIKGSPVLIANQVKAVQENAEDDTRTEVDIFPFYSNGFPFRGAD